MVAVAQEVEQEEVGDLVAAMREAMGETEDLGELVIVSAREPHPMDRPAKMAGAAGAVPGEVVEQGIALHFAYLRAVTQDLPMQE